MIKHDGNSPFPQSPEYAQGVDVVYAADDGANGLFHGLILFFQLAILSVNTVMQILRSSVRKTQMIPR